METLGKQRRGDGPTKWCKKCSRFHASRKPCDLYLRDRIAKSGRTVQRWAH